METQTRFDLATAVVNWQEELAAQPELTPIVRRELETHLRDIIADLQKRGLSNEESFWLARRRVGQPSQLSDEFAKADATNVWRERVLWMALALLAINLWGSSLNSITALIFAILTKIQPSRPSSNGAYFELIHILFMWIPILAGCVWLATRRVNYRGKRWEKLFSSNLRFATVAAVWMLINSSIILWVLANQVYHLGINLWTNLLASLVWPASLTGLLIWLMPKRKVSHPESV